ncbi:MAG: DUF6760 family protein [Methylobacter sp.]|jgi:hypothetical protein
MLKQKYYVLPAGYIDSQGVLHKEVELTPLTGREEELLANYHYPTAALVTEVLERCVKRIGTIESVTPSLLRELLVADRQYLLLMLRQLTFGDRIQATLLCPWPHCGKGVDIDFLISDVPISPCDHEKYYSLNIEKFPDAQALGLGSESFMQVRYRLPNGHDQEAFSDTSRANDVLAITTLLSRCIIKFGCINHPTAEWLLQLPPAVRLRIEQEMEARAPNLELTMEAECPECKRSFIAPFELQDFFFGELKVGTELLFREVHYLAFHYHWSEQEIMNMSRERRRRYIETLSSEIEKLNDRIE